MHDEANLYFYHYACFILSCRLLYEPVDLEDIEFTQTVLDKYVEHLGVYYGDYAYLYTAHALTHLPSQVKMHGPLKHHSQFVFEVSG